MKVLFYDRDAIAEYGDGLLVMDTTDGALAVSLPSPQDIAGEPIGVLNVGPNPVTVTTRGTGAKINDSTSYDIAAQFQTTRFVPNGKPGSAARWYVDTESGSSVLREGNSLTYGGGAYAGGGSFQPIGPDLELDADAGTSDAGDTSFLAPIMGNLIGHDLTQLHNYLGGLVGALSVTGTRATILPMAAALAILMDGVTEADGIVTAHIDGSDPSAETRARAAFAVSILNNHADSGVDYGLDLVHVPSAEEDALMSGTAVPFTMSKAALRLGVDATGRSVIVAFGLATDDAGIVTQVGADNTIADGSTYHSIDAGAGKLFQKQNDVWTNVGVPGGAIELADITDVTASAEDVNKLDGSGAVVASGTTTAGFAVAATDASEAHALNATFDDTEVEAALNALAVKYNALATNYNSLLAAVEGFDVIDIT